MNEPGLLCGYQHRELMAELTDPLSCCSLHRRQPIQILGALLHVQPLTENVSPHSLQLVTDFKNKSQWNLCDATVNHYKCYLHECVQLKKSVTITQISTFTHNVQESPRLEFLPRKTSWPNTGNSNTNHYKLKVQPLTVLTAVKTPMPLFTVSIKFRNTAMNYCIQYTKCTQGDVITEWFKKTEQKDLEIL